MVQRSFVTIDLSLFKKGIVGVQLFNKLFDMLIYSLLG